MKLEKILFREWFLVCIFLSFSALLLCSLIRAQASCCSLEPSAMTERAKVQVSVLGAVLNPGVYEVSAGTTVKEVLRMAKPKKNAHRESLPLKRFILRPCQIFVSEKEGCCRVRKSQRMSKISMDL